MPCSVVMSSSVRAVTVPPPPGPGVPALMALGSYSVGPELRPVAESEVFVTVMTSLAPIEATVSSM